MTLAVTFCLSRRSLTKAQRFARFALQSLYNNHHPPFFRRSRQITSAGSSIVHFRLSQPQFYKIPLHNHSDTHTHDYTGARTGLELDQRKAFGFSRFRANPAGFTPKACWTRRFTQPEHSPRRSPLHSRPPLSPAAKSLASGRVRGVGRTLLWKRREYTQAGWSRASNSALVRVFRTQHTLLFLASCFFALSLLIPCAFSWGTPAPSRPA